LSGIEKSSLPPDMLDLGTHTEFIRATYKAIVYHSSPGVNVLNFTFVTDATGILF
jgi:hypothetical protein